VKAAGAFCCSPHPPGGRPDGWEMLFFLSI